MVSPRAILKTASFRQSTITIGSTIINGGLGAIFYFLLARFLGSSQFGVFSLITTSMALLTGIVDLGSDQALVRFVPKYKNDEVKQSRYIKLALKIKFLSGLVVLAAITAASRPIAHFVFAKDELSLAIPLIGAGVAAQLLFSFATSLSQALERYVLWGGLFIGTNLMRLIGIIILFSVGALTGFSSTIIYILLPFIGFIFSLLFFDRKFLFVKGEGAQLSEVFKFNKWVTAFVIVATIGSRLDVFFTARFLPLASLGVYSLAQQIASILSQLTSAVGAVTSPKYASFDTGRKNISYTKKAALMTTLSAVFSGIALTVFAPIVLSFAGRDFSGGFTPFLVLTIAMIIFLSTSPIRDSILYYFGKPQFFFWTGIVQVIIVTVGSTLLIPTYGILGSSLTVLIGQIFIALSSVGYFVIMSRKL